MNGDEIYRYGFHNNDCEQKITYFIAVYDKVHKVWRPKSSQYEEIEEAQEKLDEWKRNHPGSSQKVGIFERIKAEMISEITL